VAGGVDDDKKLLDMEKDMLIYERGANKVNIIDDTRTGVRIRRASSTSPMTVLGAGFLPAVTFKQTFGVVNCYSQRSRRRFKQGLLATCSTQCYLLSRWKEV